MLKSPDSLSYPIIPLELLQLGSYSLIVKNLSEKHTPIEIDVAYLRSCDRHTKALEDELLALYKANTPPDMIKFGVKQDE